MTGAPPPDAAANPGGRPAPGEPASPTGLLVIDKPLRRTSMDVCRIVRARLRAGGAPKRVKVGHGGTLDPLATGVLVILVGKATKLCDRVMAGAKRYEAVIDLSAVSPSDDCETERQEIHVLRPPSLADLEAAAGAFIGDIQQVPPAHSAIMVEGRRAYRMARAGQTPDLAARPVRIDAIDIVDYRFPMLALDIRCGKGVYIRSLARDLGRTLGTGGMLAGLRRTAVGPWTIEQAVTLSALPDPLTSEDLLPIAL